MENKTIDITATAFEAGILAPATITKPVFDVCHAGAKFLDEHAPLSHGRTRCALPVLRALLLSVMVGTVNGADYSHSLELIGSEETLVAKWTPHMDGTATLTLSLESES